MSKKFSKDNNIDDTTSSGDRISDLMYIQSYHTSKSSIVLLWVGSVFAVVFVVVGIFALFNCTIAVNTMSKVGGFIKSIMDKNMIYYTIILCCIFISSAIKKVSFYMYTDLRKK